MKLTQYQHIALGGTFDRLHKGHKKLLSVASHFGQTITIGLTTQDLINTKAYADRIQSYEQREATLKDWFNTHHPHNQWHIIPLTDPYGPTISATSIQAIIATPHTLKGAKAINYKRQQKKLPILPIHLAPLISDDQGNYISSTRIRNGEIDRQGRVLESVLYQLKVLKDTQLIQLKSPLGVLISDQPTLISKLRTSNTELYAVGDVVSQLALKHRLPYSHLVFDDHTKRQALKNPIATDSHTHRINNPRGTVQSQASRIIKKLVKSRGRHHIKVSGEEDLLVLPYVIHAPLKSTIIYGQPNQGCVLVTVDESIKDRVYTLLS